MPLKDLAVVNFVMDLNVRTGLAGLNRRRRLKSMKFSSYILKSSVVNFVIFADEDDFRR